MAKTDPVLPSAPPRRLLILGGTTEGAALARAALQRFGDRLAVITSLAGRTEQPGAIPGDVRIGGFGGPDGLSAYLQAQAIDRVIDATHPFAPRISTEARLACAAVGVPRLMLVRPPWRRHPLDRWIEVADLAAAARAVPRLGRRAWLTVGSGDLAAFGDVIGVHFVVRLIDPPRGKLPLGAYELVLGRGPFDLAAERRLIAQHGIELLVTKASGGAATEPKLIAAREADLTVVMVRRPAREPGLAVDTVEAALDWLVAAATVPSSRTGRTAP